MMGRSSESQLYREKNLLLSGSIAEIITGWVLVSNYAICGISVGCWVPTRRLTHSSWTWLQPSLRFLLLLGIFTPIAIRPGASIYKRSWNASALSNLTGSRTERSRNGYWQPRCKQRKVSCLLKLSLRNFEDVASSYHRF